MNMQESGQIPEIEPRDIEIYSCELIEINKEENEIKFKVHCSKGTYIRTLCEDISTKLETVGFMKELNRTKVGIFPIEQSITIEELEKNSSEQFIQKHIISIEKIFENKDSVKIKESKIKHFLNGVKLTYELPNEIYKIYDEKGKFIGVGSIENKLLKREIII